MAFGVTGTTGQLLLKVVGGRRAQAFARQLADHAAPWAAEQALGLLVGQQDALAFQVLDNDAGGNIGNDRVQELRQLGHFLAVLLGQLLGLQQLQFLAAAFGNVAGDLGEPHQLPGIVVHGFNHYMGVERRAVLAQAGACFFKTPRAPRLFKV